MTEHSAAHLVDLADLGFDAGAHLLVKQALKQSPAGTEIEVQGNAPGWQAQLRGWCASQGHAVRVDGPRLWVTRGNFEAGRWRGAAHTGLSDVRATGAVADRA